MSLSSSTLHLGPSTCASEMSSAELAADEQGETKAEPIRGDELPGNLQAVIDEHQGPLLRYARHLLGDASSHDAQDVVQETFLRWHKAQPPPVESDVEGEKVVEDETKKQPDPPTPIEHPRAWLLRVTHNLAMDVIRRRQTRRSHGLRLRRHAKANPPTHLDAPNMLDAMQHREAVDAACQLMQKLPAPQPRILYLRVTEQLTLRQIAQVLDISHNRVNHQLNLGLKTLAERLKQQNFV